MPEITVEKWPLARWVTSTRRPVVTILAAYVLTLSGSLLVASLIGLIASGAKAPDFGWLMGKGLFAVAILAVFSPFFETLILAVTTSILLKFVRPQFAVVLSSVGWGVAHSYQAPIWGLVIAWPFIVFTTLYVVWKRRSLAWGLFMPFAVHALQNLLPSIAIGYPHFVPGL